MSCDRAHVRAYLPRATWLPSLECDGARLHQFYKLIFSNNNQLVNMDGCENAVGAPRDRVKLSLESPGDDYWQWSQCCAVSVIKAYSERKVRSLIQMLYNWHNLELCLYKCDYETGLIARLSQSNLSITLTKRQKKSKTCQSNCLLSLLPIVCLIKETLIIMLVRLKQPLRYNTLAVRCKQGSRLHGKEKSIDIC